MLGERCCVSSMSVLTCNLALYRYKARGAYESILPLLDEAHAEQIAKGIVSEADKKSNANFPF